MARLWINTARHPRHPGRIGIQGAFSACFNHLAYHTVSLALVLLCLNIKCSDDSVLVGGLEHFLFFHILGIMIPTDFHIFQKG
jgi:hypothetical protein